MRSLNAVIEGSPYVGYAYSYPHKSAYRRFQPPIALEDVWHDEPVDALFLYLHVPFCEYRCGFCNLFTMANAEGDWVNRFLQQLRYESEAVASTLPAAKFVRIAIGGGTPTYLDEAQLSELLGIATSLTGDDKLAMPSSCEASPATLTAGKAALLRTMGVERLSLGVQTFDDGEARTLGRPQSAVEVELAIERVRRAGFPILNLDLIYGSGEQTFDSWLKTVQRAIQHQAEEIYLYPLYVRELTGLGNSGATPRDDRLMHYRAGRDALLAAGYEQVSMRMFRKPLAQTNESPVYCCQSDGMVGLGCGARSYTRDLHYSSEFAVGRTGVRSILGDYLKRGADSFRRVHHGYRLNGAERRRRFVLQGLLQTDGLSIVDYQNHFGSGLIDDLPQLDQLISTGLGELQGERLRLTLRGLERSDAIGPWLYSPQVAALMEAFECV